MKRDGINTYLNDDNSTGQSDCLKLPSGTIVPFNSSHHEYAVGLEQAQAGQENETEVPEAPVATFPRRARPHASTHRALGHSGARRINDSNIIIDGASVTLDEHDPHSCKGCRLGNTGHGHAPIKHLRDFGRSSRGFSHFGQQMDTDICTAFDPSFPNGFTCMIKFCETLGTRAVCILPSHPVPT